MRWLVLTPLLLGACGLPERVVVRPCNPITVVPYTPAEQAQLLRELEALRSDTMTERAINDYGRVRVEARGIPACFDTIPQQPNRR